ncbi:MAG: hypothetical protein AAFO07_18890, partial [Bacteroidota bacterium]
FVRLIQRGQPLSGNESSGAKDLRIDVAYKYSNGSNLDPANIAQGTDFYAEVKVTHPGTRPIRYDEMVLNQIFPSGWEIINTRFEGFGSTGSSRADYVDIRDDRVYTFFDLRENATLTYRVNLNAAYQGRYYLPAVSSEAMYDKSIFALKSGRWVEVREPEGI